MTTLATATIRTNRYAGRCVNCAGWVPANEGRIRRSVNASGYEVLHMTCPTASPAGRHALPYSAAADEALGAAGANRYVPRHAATAVQTGPRCYCSDLQGVLCGVCRRDVPAAPVASAAPAGQAAEGFYVRGDETFRVVLNKAGTRTYAKRLAVYGDRLTWDYAPGVGRDLAAEGLTPMTAEQAGALGLLHGRCINCARPLGGSSLSAQVSALIGYGETCAAHNGWTYPTGAAAQHAYIAAH